MAFVQSPGNSASNSFLCMAAESKKMCAAVGKGKSINKMEQGRAKTELGNLDVDGQENGHLAGSADTEIERTKVRPSKCNQGCL